MKIAFLGRAAAILGLTLGLAGCFDMTTEIEVANDTSGKATTTITLSKDFYPMIKAAAAQAPANGAADAGSSDQDFCKEPGATLVENADGSATCTQVIEGAFDALKGDSDSASNDATFTVVSPGVVKVSFPTAGLKSSLDQTTQGAAGGGATPGADAQSQAADAQAQAMMKAYFEGHTITIRVKGKKVTDTNMTLAGDSTSAEIVIPLTTLLDGSAQMPDDYYATVDTN